MGRRTIWFCDGCDQEKQRSELSTFYVAKSSHYHAEKKAVSLCAKCRGISEGALPQAVTDWLGWTEPEPVEEPDEE